MQAGRIQFPQAGNYVRESARQRSASLTRRCYFPRAFKPRGINIHCRHAVPLITPMVLNTQGEDALSPMAVVKGEISMGLCIGNAESQGRDEIPERRNAERVRSRSEGPEGWTSTRQSALRACICRPVVDLADVNRVAINYSFR